MSLRSAEQVMEPLPAEIKKDGSGYWIIITDEYTGIKQQIAVTASELILLGMQIKLQMVSLKEQRDKDLK